MTGDWIDRKAAAVKLGISPDTLKKLVAARAVPFRRPPGTRLVRFAPEDIDAINAMSFVAVEKPTPVITRARRTSAA